MNRVRLYYIKHNGETELAQLDSLMIERWIASVSSEKQAVIQRLVHHRSRVDSLAGLRLLQMCASDEAIKDFKLSDVQYPKTGKPFWHQAEVMFDFNISHSADFILAVASTNMSVGIDVEKIKPLKRLNFKMVMSEDELARIQKTPMLFFDLWSKKEAVVKAANTVGMAKMGHVKLKKDTALLDEKKWFLKTLDLDSDYVINLATSKAIDELIIQEIPLLSLD